MQFGKTQERIQVKFNDECVSNNDYIDYLGIAIDAKLNFNKHLDKLEQKVKQSMNWLNNTYIKKYMTNPINKIKIYECCIKSMILYGCEIYEQVTNFKTKVNRLAKIQRLPLISITGAYRSTSIDKLNHITEIWPLKYEIILRNTKNKLRLENQ